MSAWVSITTCAFSPKPTKSAHVAQKHRLLAVFSKIGAVMNTVSRCGQPHSETANSLGDSIKVILDVRIAIAVGVPEMVVPPRIEAVLDLPLIGHAIVIRVP